MPEEKKAIEQRGTENVEAYDLYLMARNEFMAGRSGNSRRYAAALRLCQRVTEVDPNFARGWALKALAQSIQGTQAVGNDDGMNAVERALMLDANLADARAIKAYLLSGRGKFEEASSEIEVALNLDSDSYEVIRFAGLIRYRQHRFAEAIALFEKAASLVDTDTVCFFLSMSCYNAIGDQGGAKRVAALALSRLQNVLGHDPNDAAAMGQASTALAVLGQFERARELMRRAVLVEPDSLLMRYNFACMLSTQMKDMDAAIDMIGPVLERADLLVHQAKVDPDFDLIRDDPRFKAMMAAAEKRLA